MPNISEISLHDTIYKLKDEEAARVGHTHTADEIGAETSGTVNTHDNAADAHSSLFNEKEDKPTEVTGTGDITVAIADNTDYTYTAVTSLTMTGANVEAHGFVTFAASTPTISINGFAGSSGDDITSAAASEVWEFSCCNGYIVWKNWSV